MSTFVQFLIVIIYMPSLAIVAIPNAGESQCMLIYECPFKKGSGNHEAKRSNEMGGKSHMPNSSVKLLVDVHGGMKRNAMM
jgi:hypothetical protein